MRPMLFSLVLGFVTCGSTAFACPAYDGYGVVEPVQAEASEGGVYECVTSQSPNGISGKPARNKCGLWAKNAAVKNCNEMYTVANKCEYGVTHCNEVQDDGQ